MLSVYGMDSIVKGLLTFSHVRDSIGRAYKSR